MVASTLTLQLEYYLVHEFTRFLHLGELVLKVHVKIAEMEHLLTITHALDSCEQVMRHIVRMLKNVILLTINLAHSLVLDLFNRCILLFDELLYTF